MDLQKYFICIVFGLCLYHFKDFSYSRVNEFVINGSYRALQYTLGKQVDKQKFYYEFILRIVKKLGLPLEGGKLIIDNTTIDKTYSRGLEGASYVWDSRKGRSVYGYSIVQLIWVINGFHIPIMSHIYTAGEIIPGKYTKKGRPKRKRAEKTHSDLACELISFARNCLGLKPEAVYFDEVYTCEKLLRLL